MTNYEFASELGSGIYEVAGRTIQVYQLRPSYNLRPASPRAAPPGINLISPVTVGFFNFQPTDLIHLHIPTQIDALSFEPGALWQVHGIPMPRLGIRHRVAGVPSGWRLVIGDPF